MKKGFFYFAMAAFAVFCAASCGDDDEFVKPDNSKVEIPEPPTSSVAAEYQFSGDGLKSTDGESKMQALTITESGKAIVDIITPMGEKFITYDAKVENGRISIYDEFGNLIGEAQEVGTKGSASVSLILDCEIIVNGKTYSFKILKVINFYFL